MNFSWALFAYAIIEQVEFFFYSKIFHEMFNGKSRSLFRSIPMNSICYLVSLTPIYMWYCSTSNSNCLVHSIIWMTWVSERKSEIRFVLCVLNFVSVLSCCQWWQCVVYILNMLKCSVLSLFSYIQCMFECFFFYCCCCSFYPHLFHSSANVKMLHSILCYVYIYDRHPNHFNISFLYFLWI